MLILPPNATRKAKAARAATKGLREVLITYRALMEDAVREEGLTLPQLRMLHAVSENGDVSAATIARICQVTPQTLQIMLARAEREGWVTRSTSERNQRITNASLTAKGNALLQRGSSLVLEIETKMWRGVSLASLENFNQQLQAGLANLKAR